MKKIAILVLVAFFLIYPVLGAMEELAAGANVKEKGPIIVDEGNGVKKAIFIHYAKKDALFTPTKAYSATCYGFLTDAHPQWWSPNVPYVINPRNNQGLTQPFIGKTISTSAETWDAGTSTDLFKDTYTFDTRARFGKRDGRNVLAFGNYGQRNVIAVTYIWFRDTTIFEFDILFDTDFQWGDAEVNPAKMDLQNIATHEVGHGIGLDDMYEDACVDVTMFGFSDEGETIKRTLERPDVTGLQTLY